VLQLRGVQKRFGDIVAVHGITLDVVEGEFLFLIGPSGCGKTTTLRMIGGYEAPTSGEIWIRGRLMNDLPLDKRNIGMVFQSYALFPHMTVKDNVAFGLKTRKVPRSERRERVEAALKLVALDGLGARYPAQLSGGQRQRVALARVIVYEPDILLLDEPLANLDKRLRDAMRIELKKLQETVGITSIYVTHDQEEALTMADRIAVMDQGHLLQIGSPAEVYNEPRTSFVATFLGETSSFRGTVESLQHDVAMVALDEHLVATVCHNGDVSVGDELTVSIRPERVRVSLERPGRDTNVFSGVIDFVSYLGAQVLYMIRLNGRRTIKASQPIPSGRATFQVGERVFVSWNSEMGVYIKEK
jgi:spermidine/putrescine ABC transporter ATP-binding subunit